MDRNFSGTINGGNSTCSSHVDLDIDNIVDNLDISNNEIDEN